MKKVLSLAVIKKSPKAMVLSIKAGMSLAIKAKITAKKRGAKKIYKKFPLFNLNGLFLFCDGSYFFASDMFYPNSFPSGYHTVSPAESRINRKPNIFCNVVPFPNKNCYILS